MSDTTIHEPGNGDVDLRKNDTLTIKFDENVTVYIRSGNPHAFKPHFPDGDHDEGRCWCGTATSKGSVTFESVPRGKTAAVFGARTVQIGDGTGRVEPLSSVVTAEP